MLMLIGHHWEMVRLKCPAKPIFVGITLDLWSCYADWLLGEDVYDNVYNNFDPLLPWQPLPSAAPLRMAGPCPSTRRVAAKERWPRGAGPSCCVIADGRPLPFGASRGLHGLRREDLR
eukprot:9462439-Heterocapsa_arctica.AAC.1